MYSVTCCILLYLKYTQVLGKSSDSGGGAAGLKIISIGVMLSMAVIAASL